VIVFGVGGVGSFVLEALPVPDWCNRFGGQRYVNITNINRQIVALHSTIGRKKVERDAGGRIRHQSESKVILHDTFATREISDNLIFPDNSYVIDAIDTVSSNWRD
jgi:tRNA A37 threonylcarbamoyladenosine dehydratase